jgi:hypothetical protein
MFYVGVVGHRYLADQKTEDFVSEQSLKILEQARCEHADLVALSAIAEGADTLFAEAALVLGIPLEIVRPFKVYGSDFAKVPARERYEKLRSAARDEESLDHEKRSDAAYKAAMSWIVRRSDLLVAAWDGLPAEGVGGTGDAVRQAVQLGKAWSHLDVRDLSVTSHGARPVGTEEAN